ncbi:hypothetical protein BJV74DRAFT_887677 [Russula compacta]|nr:hypothetical protein BJV74DRAFT_887677 [Russula compacta]
MALELALKHVMWHKLDIALGVVAIPAIISSVLAAFGFGAAGPIAGSMAAAWQATIGNVVGGSLFAWLQSLAMGGAKTGIVSTIGGIIGGLCGIVAGAFKL